MQFNPLLREDSVAEKEKKRKGERKRHAESQTLSAWKEVAASYVQLRIIYSCFFLFFHCSSLFFTFFHGKKTWITINIQGNSLVARIKEIHFSVAFFHSHTHKKKRERTISRFLPLLIISFLYIMIKAAMMTIKKFSMSVSFSRFLSFFFLFTAIFALFRWMKNTKRTSRQLSRLLPNVAEKISFSTIILALLPYDGIHFQTALPQHIVLLLQHLECGILLLYRLLHSRINPLYFHLVLFVDALQFRFDFVACLLLQIVFLSGVLLAELRNAEK